MELAVELVQELVLELSLEMPQNAVDAAYDWLSLRVSSRPLTGGEYPRRGRKSPPTRNPRGGVTPPLKSPPYRGGVFRTKGGTRGEYQIWGLGQYLDTPPLTGGE